MSLVFPSLSSEVLKQLVAKLTVVKKDAFSLKSIVFLRLENGRARVPFNYGRLMMIKGFKAEPRVPSRKHSGQPSDILREDQKVVIEEAMASIKVTKSLTLKLPVGFGKTILGSTMASMIGLKTFIVAPRVSLFIQWKTSIEMVSPGSTVHIVGGEKGQSPIEEADFVIGSVSASTKLPPTIGTIIIDECHMLCVSSTVKLLDLTPEYVIGLSATPERTDGLHSMMKLLIGDRVISRLPEREYVVKRVDVPVTVEESYTTKGINVVDMYRKLSESQEMNERVLNIIIDNPERKFIILTKLVDHVHHLSEMLNGQGISCGVLCGKMKTYEDSRVLIGTMSKIGTGFDEATSCESFMGRPSDSLILFHVPKAYQIFAQCGGRAMRSLEVPVIYVMLPLNELPNRHFNGLKTYIQSTGGRIE